MSTSLDHHFIPAFFLAHSSATAAAAIAATAAAAIASTAAVTAAAAAIAAAPRSISVSDPGAEGSRYAGHARCGSKEYEEKTGYNQS
jgi:hypothetical protein